jgi:hypothetical protein
MRTCWPNLGTKFIRRISGDLYLPLVADIINSPLTLVEIYTNLDTVYNHLFSGAYNMYIKIYNYVS